MRDSIQSLPGILRPVLPLYSICFYWTLVSIQSLHRDDSSDHEYHQRKKKTKKTNQTEQGQSCTLFVCVFACAWWVPDNTTWVIMSLISISQQVNQSKVTNGRRWSLNIRPSSDLSPTAGGSASAGKLLCSLCLSVVLTALQDFTRGKPARLNNSKSMLGEIYSSWEQVAEKPEGVRKAQRWEGGLPWLTAEEGRSGN